jgi:hypothetical protein
MWPMPALTNKFVAIFFTQDSLVCCSVTKTKNGVTPFVLDAYKSYSLDNHELHNLTLFNPTIIKQHIVSFLTEHNLQNAFVAFVLDGPAVQEQFVTMPTATPQRTDFDIPNSAHMIWEYQYMYPTDSSHFVFYLYSVPRSVLLQYKLLAIAAQCNLITVTTQTMALLSAYQHMFGNAFRRSQLAIDMMRCNNNIGDLITIDTVRRMMDISGIKLSKDDYVQCIAAAGLFCSEGLKL